MSYPLINQPEFNLKRWPLDLKTLIREWEAAWNFVHFHNTELYEEQKLDFKHWIEPDLTYWYRKISQPGYKPSILDQSMLKVLIHTNDDVLRSGIDNPDNYRIARIDNPIEIENYQNYYNRGCCGFFDINLSFYTKKGQALIKYGFNYGH